VKPKLKVPEIIQTAWREFGDPRHFVGIRDTSANVSTNSVYRLQLSDGTTIFAKVSSYGSFAQFREDHERIHACNLLFSSTPYAGLLADALTHNHKAFTYHNGEEWVIFYDAVEIREPQPKILSLDQVANLAQEIARFHLASLEISTEIAQTTKCLRSDVYNLLDLLHANQWHGHISLSKTEKHFLIDECEILLDNLTELGYDSKRKIPVMIDWNIGNFSVESEGGPFKLYSRWDYDWFRIEPRVFDFYFCSRVTSAVGDKTNFVYGADTLVQDRFKVFLRAYHEIFPLAESDILFLKDVYRFFILNYVIRDGEHFFRPKICKRLQRQSVSTYLPQLRTFDFSPLLKTIE